MANRFTTWQEMADALIAHETALSKLTERVEAIEAKAQGKGYYPQGIVERLEEIDSRLTGLHNDSVLYGQEWAKITRRLEALEDEAKKQKDAFRKLYYGTKNILHDAPEPIEPITGHGVRYRWCDVDETAPDPEEPKPYPQAAENQSGTLKACPLCGNTGRLLQEGRDYQVACTICTAAETPYFRDKVDAIAAWNRRPIEDELRAEIEQLKETYFIDKPSVHMPASQWHKLQDDLSAAQAKIERLKDDWEDKQKDASYWEDRFNEVATDLTAARERISNAIVELQNNYAQDGAKVAAALCRLAALGEKE